MKELALHILDIAENSIKGNATEINITIKEDLEEDILKIEIKDNGDGIDEATLKKVADPFYTTRTTRKVGMGLSLFKLIALQCNGTFEIKSTKWEGTSVTADFQHSHIDRPPIGKIEETIVTLITSSKDINYIYTHYFNKYKFRLSTLEVKSVLQDVEITEVEVLYWLRDYIKEKLEEVVKK